MKKQKPHRNDIFFPYLVNVKGHTGLKVTSIENLPKREGICGTWKLLSKNWQFPGEWVANLPLLVPETFGVQGELFCFETGFHVAQGNPNLLCRQGRPSLFYLISAKNIAVCSHTQFMQCRGSNPDTKLLYYFYIIITKAQNIVARCYPLALRKNPWIWIFFKLENSLYLGS